MSLDLLHLEDLEQHLAHDREIADAGSIVTEAWIRAWTVDPPMTVSEWADANRVIGEGAGAEPGPWRTARTPYLREIQDCLSDHSDVQVVDFKKSAQIGATEIGINWTGYVIDRGLDSMIVAQPVKDLARSWALSKFEPGMFAMPSLCSKIDSNNTLEKRFPGGTLWIIWANSSNQLRSRTARYLFEDEVDEYPDDLGGQGSATQQLEARAMSYGSRAKIYRACTPTIAGASNIDAGYQEGDQRHYLLPCPHCMQHQALEIGRLQPNGTFACAHCGAEIEERHKEWMLAERSPERPWGAYWAPSNPSAPPEHRSYHIWAAYMPTGLGLTWLEIAERRKKAERDPAKLAGFTNLVLGEVFEGERQQVSVEAIAARAEPGVHRGRVPRGGLRLSIGVDCQHDRFEAHVLAWGRGQRARIVDYDVIPGDPSSPDGYGELDAWLQRTYLNCNGAEMLGEAVAIDGGNWTEMVAQFVKNRVHRSGQARMVRVGAGYRPQKIYVVRGRSAKSDRVVYRPAKSEVNHREKTIARSVGVWGVGTDVAKHILYGWLTADGVEGLPIEQRMLRFPGGRGEAFDPTRPDPGQLPPNYFAMLSAEFFDLSARKWICRKGERNEAWDTLVYAYWAALASFKLDMIRDHEWAALERAYEAPTSDLFAVGENASRETQVSPTDPPPALTVRGALQSMLDILVRAPLAPVDRATRDEWRAASGGNEDERALLSAVLDQLSEPDAAIAAQLDEALLARVRQVLRMHQPAAMAPHTPTGGRRMRSAGVS